MSKSVKKILSFVVFSGLFLSFTSAAFAEASSSEKSVTGFFRRLFNYPVKATQETAGMTANTLQNAGEKVVAKTGENIAAVATAQPQKADLVAPVTGAAETVGQTAAETVAVPVKAAEEDKK